MRLKKEATYLVASFFNHHIYSKILYYIFIEQDAANKAITNDPTNHLLA